MQSKCPCIHAALNKECVDLTCTQKAEPSQGLKSNSDNLGNIDGTAPTNEKTPQSQGFTAFDEVESPEAQLNFFSPPSLSGTAMWCVW
ncbi:MAG: hypothetical protein AB8B91_08575 [Rubripirellula sp.]